MQSKPYIIGIAGPSGSGKSTLAHRLAAVLSPESTEIVCLDHYCRDLTHIPIPERSLVNFDTPDALESELIRKHIKALSEGNTIYRPTYDYISHTRSSMAVEVKAKRYVIVEGLFALYWEDIYIHFDFKVFIRSNIEDCFVRRSERDVKERGRTLSEVKALYEEKVRPMYYKYIQPTSARADLTVALDETDTAINAILRHMDQPTDWKSMALNDHTQSS